MGPRAYPPTLCLTPPHPNCTVSIYVGVRLWLMTVHNYNISSIMARKRFVLLVSTAMAVRLAEGTQPRLPWWLNGKESTCQRRRLKFDSWVGKIPWKREWHPTPVCLPGEFHGQRSLVGYSPWGCKGSDWTEQLIHAVRTKQFLLIPGFVKKQHALFKGQQQK